MNQICYWKIGKNVFESDSFNSSTIESRIEDLHDAFADPNVKCILTVIGWFNSNQLLKYIDYDLIKKNPKIICGFSDITALNNAIYTKTWLVTYIGLHFSTFAMEKEFDYNLKYFKKCLMENKKYEIKSSSTWSDDAWYKDQDNRDIIRNEGCWIINEWTAKWTIIWGNQCTLNLLQGTEFMPSLKWTILFLEDDDEAHIAIIDRDLQSIIHLPWFQGVKWIVIGRFQKETAMTRELLTQIIKTKKELEWIPVIWNADFGHTNPMFSFPIGGTIEIEAEGKGSIRILEH